MFQIMMSTRFVIIPWASSRSEKSSQKSNGQTHKCCYNWGSNHTGTSVNGFRTSPKKRMKVIIIVHRIKTYTFWLSILFLMQLFINILKSWSIESKIYIEKSQESKNAPSGRWFKKKQINKYLLVEHSYPHMTLFSQKFLTNLDI